MIPTPHIEASAEEIAKIVIMPGDPLRAKYIAETYLENSKLINQVRGVLGYTGMYKGKEVTIMASGMGMASMGIYSYELFQFYNVDKIIRVGTCGAYTEDIQIRDVILVDSTFAKTDYSEMVGGTSTEVLYSSKELNGTITMTAKRMGILLNKCRTHCSDAFYSSYGSADKYYYENQCLAVEMEAFSLFQNANVTNKQAACILTVSDNVITGEKTSSDERQKSFNQMIELALESIL